MKRIVIVCPNVWERDLAEAAFLRGRYQVLFHGEDAQMNPRQLDVLGFIDEATEALRSRDIDGIGSSADYPNCIVAAGIARALGLPSADPAKLLLCSHKYYARIAQREAVPDATPRFALIDPDRPGVDGLAFPLFVKPVKSCFSAFAQRVETPEDLAEFVHRGTVRSFLEGFTRPFNDLLRRYTDFEYDARYLLAEELLRGQQVTVEGFVHQGRIELIGVVDSIMHPGTISFARFDYPSALPLDVQGRMADVARSAIARTGLDDSLFNVEMFHDPAAGSIKLIEINPRMVGQFADLHEKVDGTNTFELLFALAVGERPEMQRGAGAFRRASSFPLRVFQDRLVGRVPTVDDVAEIERRFPGTRVFVDCHEGARLSDQCDDLNDLSSYCYGFLNMGGSDQGDLLRSFGLAYEQLGFQLAVTAA